MKRVRDIILRDSKITADGDWSHEIKTKQNKTKNLVPWKKIMTNLDNILKTEILLC